MPGYRSESLVENLAGKIDTFVKMEMDLQGVGNFVRVWVKLDVDKH